jgi:hypothetical protein
MAAPILKGHDFSRAANARPVLKGHDFSRAANARIIIAASAAEGRFILPLERNRIFRQPVPNPHGQPPRADAACSYLDSGFVTKARFHSLLKKLEFALF